ncbi:MAG: universal stress protein [Deltaproteobacteria bacterium]|nr:universal stress protein [Candidatus Zymogenaceae bacterium]
MHNINKILVALDGSDVSMRAFSWASDLACVFSAELIVLAVSDKRKTPEDETSPAFMTDREVKNLVEVYAEKYEELFKAITDKCSDAEVPVSTVTLHGLPSQEIVQLAIDEDADLIVMGAHGKKEEFYHEFTSTSERVLKKSPCPVLMIVPERKREKTKPGEPKQKKYTPILHST